jgi:sodium transport system permease protein
MLSIARKELREAVRDRRSLLSGLFYGVWGPMVMALALTALARDRGSDTPLTLTVEGGARAASLMAFFAERMVTILDGSADAPRIRARDLPVALVVSDDYAADFRAAKPATVTVLYDGSWTDSRNKAERVRTLLAEYARRVNDTRLVLRGINPSAVSALDIAERDLSTAAARAGVTLGALPIFVLLAAFIGGMSVAADVTAGERERGSLEALLMNPVPRLALVAGKWAATSLVALATVAVTLAVTHAILRHPRIQAIDLPVGISPGDAALMGLLLAPLALLAAAVQLLIALRARTYKEAQTHLSLMMFLPMIPGFMFAFGSLQPAAWMTRLPMLGQHLMISDIVRGQAPDAGVAAGLTAMTLAFTAVALWAAARLMGEERIVRRLAG